MAEGIFIQIDEQKIEAKDDQLAYIIQAMTEIQTEAELVSAQLVAAEQARKSAIAKLEKLGLTVEEVQAVFGLSADV